MDFECEDTDFYVKESKELIKVPKCQLNYDLEKYPTKYFYICPCSRGKYMPVCYECAMVCHSHIKLEFQIKIENKAFICQCGEANHVTGESTILNSSVFLEEYKHKCPFNYFMQMQISIGYIQTPSGESYCPICWNSCLKRAVPPNTKYSQDGKCDCSNHENHNPVSMNKFFLNIDFNVIKASLMRFDFNLFESLNFLKIHYIEYLQVKLNKIDLLNEAPEKKSILIFSDLFIFEIGALYYFISQKEFSKTVRVKPIFSINQANNLIRLINFPEDNRINEMESDQLLNKLHFMFLIYDMHIKNYMNRYNIMPGLHSMSNLNVLQRIVILNKSKDFYLFNDIKTTKRKTVQINNNFAMPNLIEYIETLFKLTLRLSSFPKISSKGYEIVSCIYKELIKYFLVLPSDLISYLNLIIDILSKDSSKKLQISEFRINSNKDSMFEPNLIFNGISFKTLSNLIKTIYYLLLAINDCAVLKKIQRKEESPKDTDIEKDYCFQLNFFNNNINYLFANLIVLFNKFNKPTTDSEVNRRFSRLKKYIQLCLDLNLNKDCIYTSNITGIFYNSENSKKILDELDNDEFQIIFRNKYFNRIYAEILLSVNESLFKVTLDYEYNTIPFEKFSNDIDEIFIGFINFFNTKLSGATDQKLFLDEICLILKFSNFFNILKRLLNVNCSHVVQSFYISKTDDMNDQPRCLPLLLQFFTTIIEHDDEILALFFNINSDALFNTFFYEHSFSSLIILILDKTFKVDSRIPYKEYVVDMLDKLVVINLEDLEDHIFVGLIRIFSIITKQICIVCKNLSIKTLTLFKVVKTIITMFTRLKGCRFYKKYISVYLNPYEWKLIMANPLISAEYQNMIPTIDNFWYSYFYLLQELFLSNYLVHNIINISKDSKLPMPLADIQKYSRHLDKYLEYWGIDTFEEFYCIAIRTGVHFNVLNFHSKRYLQNIYKIDPVENIFMKEVYAFSNFMNNYDGKQDFKSCLVVLTDKMKFLSTCLGIFCKGCEIMKKVHQGSSSELVIRLSEFFSLGVLRPILFIATNVVLLKEKVTGKEIPTLYSLCLKFFDISIEFFESYFIVDFALITDEERTNLDTRLDIGLYGDHISLLKENHEKLKATSKFMIFDIINIIQTICENLLNKNHQLALSESIDNGAQTFDNLTKETLTPDSTTHELEMNDFSVTKPLLIDIKSEREEIDSQSQDLANKIKLASIMNTDRKNQKPKEKDDIARLKKRVKNIIVEYKNLKKVLKGSKLSFFNFVNDSTGVNSNKDTSGGILTFLFRNMTSFSQADANNVLYKVDMISNIKMLVVMFQNTNTFNELTLDIMERISDNNQFFKNLISHIVVNFLYSFSLTQILRSTEAIQYNDGSIEKLHIQAGIEFLIEMLNIKNFRFHEYLFNFKLDFLEEVKYYLDSPNLNSHRAGLEEVKPTEKKVFIKDDDEDTAGKFINDFAKQNIQEASSNKFNLIGILFKMIDMLLYNYKEEKGIIVCEKESDLIAPIIVDFFNLAKELIKGSSNKYFKQVYFSLGCGSIFSSGKFESVVVDNFLVIRFLEEFSSTFFNHEDIFNSETISMKNSVFSFLSNIFTLSIDISEFIDALNYIFGFDKLFEISILILKGIFHRHFNKVSYPEPLLCLQRLEYYYKAKDIDFDDKKLDFLVKSYFKESFEDDDWFSLLMKIIKILYTWGYTYNNPNIIYFLHLRDFEINEGVISYCGVDEDKDKLLTFYEGIQSPNKMNLIYLSKFLEKIIRQCEFMLPSINNYNVDPSLNNLINVRAFFCVPPKYSLCEIPTLEQIMGDNYKSSTTILKNLITLSDEMVFQINNKKKLNLTFFNYDLLSMKFIDAKSPDDMDETTIESLEKTHCSDTLVEERSLDEETHYFDIDHIYIVNICCAVVLNFHFFFFFSDISRSHDGFIWYIQKLSVILTFLVSIFLVFYNLINLYVFLTIQTPFLYKLSLHREAVAKGANPNLLSKKQHKKHNHSTSPFEDMKMYLDYGILTYDALVMIVNIMIPIIIVCNRKLSFLCLLLFIVAVKFFPNLNNIAKSFTLRFTHIMAMIIFCAILILFYSMIGFYFLQSDMSGLTPTVDNPLETPCSTIIECFIFYFNVGMKNGGGIGDSLPGLDYGTTGYWFKFALNMVFYITIILLLLNMINGIIIATFSSLRQEKEQRDYIKSNTCLICGISKLEFEKEKISFGSHCFWDHNVYSYLQYFVALKLQYKKKGFNSQELFIWDNLIKSKIVFYPVHQCLALGKIEDNAVVG